MNRTFLFASVMASCALAAAAQETGGKQTYYGVLMDASCRAISSGAAKPDISSATPEKGAASATASGPGTSGAYASTGTAVDTASRTAPAAVRNQAGMPLPPATATGTDVAPNRSTGTERKALDRAGRSAAGVDIPRATGNPSDMPRTTSATATGAGTSGAYAANGIAGSGGPAVHDSGERSRAESPANPVDSSSFTSVREKYGDCIAQPSTTRFAVHVDGRVILLDEASNRMIQDRLRSEAFSANMRDASGGPKWMSVTITGSEQGRLFHASSIQAGAAGK